MDADLLNTEEIAALREAALNISRLEFGQLTDAEVEQLSDVMKSAGVAKFAQPAHDFADKLEVVEYDDGRGFSVEYEIAPDEGVRGDYIILVFEILRNEAGSTVAFHYAYL